MVKVPAAVGVPVMAPVLVLTVRPAGSVPVATEKVNGPVPPETVMAGLLNATPTSPEFTAEQASEGPATMVKGQVPVATAPFLSVTLMVKVPAAVGVPVMAPVLALSVKPAGRVPVATEKVNGAVPPETVMAGLLNRTPPPPEFTAEQASEGPATMVKGHVPVASAPLASMTLMVKVPAAVGVPVMAPVLALSVKPAGR